MLRIAVITDIHYGLDKNRRLGTRAPALMEGFIKAVNALRPHLVVDMGDRISSHSPSTDEHYMKRLQQVFNRMAAPVHSLLGNNDQRHLSRADNARIMGQSMDSHIMQVQGCNLVFWNPDVDTDKPGGLTVDKADMDWLTRQVQAATGPVLLFSHVPLDNFPDDDRKAAPKDFGPNRSYYPQGPQIRAMLSQSGKVALCMAGHKHLNRHRTIDGVHYIIQQSLSQQINGRNDPYGAWSFLEIDDGMIRIKGYGHQQPDYRLPLKLNP